MTGTPTAAIAVSTRESGMALVPASLAVLFVRRSGYPCTSATLRSWVRRGHITRQPGGYDLAEITVYLRQHATRTEKLDKSINNCNASSRATLPTSPQRCAGPALNRDGRG